MIPCPQYEIWQYCPAWKQIRKEERDTVLDDLYRFAKENRCGWGFVDGVDAYRTELRQAGSP